MHAIAPGNGGNFFLESVDVTEARRLHRVALSENGTKTAATMLLAVEGDPGWAMPGWLELLRA